MRFHLFLAVAASLSSVFAQDQTEDWIDADGPALSLKLTRPGNKRAVKPPAAQCAVSGSQFLPAYYATQQLSMTAPGQCGALCRSDFKCQSYAVGPGACYLYLLPVTKFVKKSAKGPFTFYDRACATNTNLCQVNGLRLPLAPPFLTSTALPNDSLSGCAALCQSTSGCKSYSIGIGNGQGCRLYRSPLSSSFLLDPKSLNLFWDIGCPLTVVGPTLAIPAVSTSVPTTFTQEAVQTFPPPSVAPTLTSSDSPPYTPTGPQVTPTDDHLFTQTYTYEESDLPTPVAMGSPPVTTGIAQPTSLSPPPCLVDTGSQAQFSVLDTNYIPMVSKASNSFGPLPQPTVQPAANDPILNPESLVLPGFYFQQPSGAPANVYDLVYAGSTTQYVAMTNTGNVVLTGSSTGSNFKNNLVTTIFSVDCFGRITVNQGGSSYIWSTSGSITKMVKGTSTVTNMVALPKVIPAVQEARKNRKRNQQLAKKLLDKRSYTDGPAPKCSANPPGLVPKTKQGFKPDQGNFCDNVSDYWSLSPFDFDGSCAIQSLCYDQCEDFGWQSCNGIFGTSMLLSCAEHFSGWWEALAGIACVAQASYFTGVAATKTGWNLFYDAQGAMCRCFCSSPPDTCLFSDGSFYCADLHGSDGGNCGNCGTQCGPKSKCRNGVCGCLNDQCGDKCVNLQTHPQNCGSCGNVCPQPYCVSGQCYAPKPDECAPDQPVQNGGFSPNPNYFDDWTFNVYPGCSGSTNFQVIPVLTGTDPADAAFFEFSNLPAGGCAISMVQTQMKVCPNVYYQFSFGMSYITGDTVNQGNFPYSAPCTVTWLTGTPTDPNNPGSFQSHSWTIDKSQAWNFQSFSGWRFNINPTDAGVTQVLHKQDLFIDLTAVIQCQGDQGGQFFMSGIEMTVDGFVNPPS